MIELTFIAPTTGETQIVSVDAVIDESHRSSALITEHPVEDGSSVSDHSRPDQDTLTMTIMVTNTPIKENVSANVQGSFTELNLGAAIDLPPTRTGAPKLINEGRDPRRLPFGGLVPGVVPQWEASELINRGQDTNAPNATVLQFPEVFDRVNLIYSVMHALLQTATIVRVVTRLRTYENMLIEELTTPVDAKDSIQFSVTVKQVRIVDTQTVTAPPDPAEERGRRRSNAGGQQTDDANEEEQTRSSLWMNLARSAGLL